jgi:serine/threonine protein phosphatase PrpC
METAIKEHRVDKFAEQRVLAHGGEVRVGKVGDVETRRIFARGSNFPGLAMARCLGDQEAQRLGASCEPEFTFLPFDSRNTLVVASDGVWDMLSPSETAVRLARAPGRGVGKERAGELACAIVCDARKLYPMNGDIDDITAVVVQAMPEARMHTKQNTSGYFISGA